MSAIALRHRPPRWWIGRAGVAVAVLLAASLLTYRDWVDGPFTPFLLAHGAGLLAAALAALWWLFPPGAPRLPWLALPLALLAALPAPAVHVARLATGHAEQGSALGSLVEYGRVLAPVLQGDGTFAIDRDALDLRAPSGSTAYVELRWPRESGSEWRLPRAMVDPHHPRQQESVSWRAGVQRDNRYFVLAEAGRLLVQLTDGGVLITAPDATGRATAETVALPLSQGQPVAWALQRDGRRVRLSADGREVWSGPDSGPLAPTRLGETRTDGEHGGRMRLSDVRMRRWTA